MINGRAGVGKTIRLSQCAAALTHAIAWVSLDGVDDDPTVLLTEIATAVDRIVSVEPAIFVHLLSPEPAIGAEVVPRRLNSLAQAPQMALLLDDAHLVRGSSSASALGPLCEHLQATVRVILATREAQHLPLASPRATGSLLEFWLCELALTAPEARELLGAAEVSFEVDAFEVLFQGIEGWAAGLSLAALSTRESRDSSRGVREFSGDNRNALGAGQRRASHWRRPEASVSAQPIRCSALGEVANSRPACGWSIPNARRDGNAQVEENGQEERGAGSRPGGRRRG